MNIIIVFYICSCPIGTITCITIPPNSPFSPSVLLFLLSSSYIRRETLFISVCPHLQGSSVRVQGLRKRTVGYSALLSKNITTTPTAAGSQPQATVATVPAGTRTTTASAPPPPQTRTVKHHTAAQISLPADRPLDGVNLGFASKGTITPTAAAPPVTSPTAAAAAAAAATTMKLPPPPRFSPLMMGGAHLPPADDGRGAHLPEGEGVRGIPGGSGATI